MPKVPNNKRKAPNLDPLSKPARVISGDGLDAPSPLKDYEPDAKKKELLRILRWPELAYYEILEVDEDATEDVIKKAYLRKAKLTHSDRNDDVQAKEGFQRVQKAFDTLSNQEMRKKYNEDRKLLNAENKLLPQDFDESFELGAYASNTDSDDSDDEEEPMSKEKEAIIEEMAPFVKAIINSCDIEAKAKLEGLNDKMIEQNKSERVFATSHCPPIESFEKIGKKRMKLLKTIQSKRGSEVDEAKKKLNALQERLENQMTALDLPKTWTFDSPYAEASKNPSDKSNKGEKTQSDYGPRSPRRAGEGGEPMEVDWQPGLTSRGERILAYRPISRIVVEKGTGRRVETETVNDFVIEKQGELNSIDIVNIARVGLVAANAYLALPDNQKNSITNIDQQYDQSDGPSIRGIKGFARKEQTSPAGILPWGVVLIDYDGNDRVINRTALRKARGGAAADELINQFLIDIDEEPEESRHSRLLLRFEHTRKQLQLEDRSRISRRDMFSDSEDETGTRARSNGARGKPGYHEKGQEVITRSEVDKKIEQLMEKMTEKISLQLSQLKLASP